MRVMSSPMIRNTVLTAYMTRTYWDILVIPMRLHHSSGYHTMGLFAMGTSAFGNSFGFDVNVFSDTPGPHKMRAWKPVEGSVACGMMLDVE
jgi:hypothetical protein